MSAQVNPATKIARIDYDPSRARIAAILEAIRTRGYTVGTATARIPIKNMHCSSCVLPWNKGATAAEDTLYKTVDGLAVYLGVVPAEIVKGHPSGHAETTMHGGSPKGRHEYHVVAAIFDSATGARASDATVTAQISGLGLSGTQKKSNRWR